MSSSPYRGRFAPSPTGPLHLGSLLAALASFLDARATGGDWLVRMEDLDPPREQPGAGARILDSLCRHGLHWRGGVLYQHQRSAAYDRVIGDLLDGDLAFYCTCSRQDLQRNHGEHTRDCPQSRTPPARPSAIRARATGTNYRFDDIFLGSVTLAGPRGVDDFVIRRRDGLYAYQLAVVVDDIYQGITHVVRGRDLLDSTPHQIFLRATLGLPPLQYGHVPLLLNRHGQKLSKQNLAPALDDRDAAQNILFCLDALGQPLPPRQILGDCPQLLQWAIDNWDRSRVPQHDRVA